MTLEFCTLIQVLFRPTSNLQFHLIITNTVALCGIFFYFPQLLSCLCFQNTTILWHFLLEQPPPHKNGDVSLSTFPRIQSWLLFFRHLAGFSNQYNKALIKNRWIFYQKSLHHRSLKYMHQMTADFPNQTRQTLSDHDLEYLDDAEDSQYKCIKQFEMTSTWNSMKSCGCFYSSVGVCFILLFLSVWYNKIWHILFLQLINSYPQVENIQYRTQMHVILVL